MNSNDIVNLQIIATTKDNQHIITITEDSTLIVMAVSLCKFFKLDEKLFENYSLMNLIQENFNYDTERKEHN